MQRMLNQIRTYGRELPPEALQPTKLQGRIRVHFFPLYCCCTRDPGPPIISPC